MNTEFLKFEISATADALGGGVINREMYWVTRLEMRGETRNETRTVMYSAPMDVVNQATWDAAREFLQ
jgi:hypothetical protein